MLRLDAKLVDQLLRARGFEGLSELALRLGVHRSTLWRWMHGGPAAFPGSSSQFLRLAAALDVDPLALLEYAPEDFARLSARVQRVALTGDWSHFLPALDFLGDLLTPAESWPPVNVAAAYDRSWFVRDLAVEPRAQGLGYATLRLAPPPQRSEHDVFAWHLAFQDTGGALPLPWRARGYLRWLGGEARLHSVRGLLNHDELRGQPGVDVELWVGPHAGTLRVASLHDFSVEWAARQPADPLVRMCEQGLPCLAAQSEAPCELAPRCTGYRSPAARAAYAALNAPESESPRSQPAPG